MTYLIKNRYDETVVDIATLTWNLAPLLGGTLVEVEGQLRGAIIVGELPLSLNTQHGANFSRVQVSAHCPDKIRRYLGHAGLPDFPSMTFSVDRPLDAIARDIKKRVIEAGAEPLLKAQQMFNNWTDITEQTRKAAMAIAEKYPKVRFNPMPSDKPTNRADFSTYADGVSFSGYVNADGCVRFDRVEASPDQAAAIFKLLMKGT